ncbi:MAG: DUF2284 domain-containing protein [bacterium]|nr:DUF2284 domain-containing protein [bacterium]
MRPEACTAEAERIAPVSDEGPGAAFLDFHERERPATGDTLLALMEGDGKMRGFTLRAGMMPPGSAVVDERIRRFCRLPYRTDEGMVAACPGILGGWKGCPPHSPAVARTVDLLSRARCLLIVQFEGSEGRVRQGRVHPFIDRAAEALRGRGYDILGTYACGPCRVCPRGCGEEQECRQPERRLFSLEACGFWVNVLCREAAAFPVCGDGPREIRWIRNWGLADQDTETVRYVTGVLIG